MAAVWRLAEQEEGGHYLRASAGYGFRNPSLRELWFDMPVVGGAGRIIGNKNLEPEQMRSFELGYWGQPIPRLRTTANAYFNLVDRLVQFLPQGGGVFQPHNDDKDRAYGAELEIEYQAARWLYTFANYSFGVRRNRDTGDENLSGPRNKANLGGRISFLDDRLTGSLWATYFGKVEFVDPAAANNLIGMVHEYALLNARVAYRLPFAGTDSLAFVQAFNLLDRDHREHPEGNKYGLLLLAGFESRW